MQDVDIPWYGHNLDIRPSFAYGFGLSYGDIPILQSLVLRISAEVDVVRLETASIDVVNEVEAQYRYRGIPMFFWGKLHQSGVLGPYVKGGIGAIHSLKDQEYYDASQLNLHSDYWSSGFGVGAGIRVSPLKELDILLTGEQFVGTDGGWSENSRGDRLLSSSPLDSDFLG